MTRAPALLLLAAAAPLAAEPPKASCPAPARAAASSSHPLVHPLGQEPAAEGYMALYRRENGCPKPLKLREWRAAPR